MFLDLWFNVAVNCFELGTLTTDKVSIKSRVLSCSGIICTLNINYLYFRSNTKLCGSSVVIVATFADHSAFAMNLKFLNSFLFERLPAPKYLDISVSDPIVVLVSCKINPSTGGLAVTSPSFGITYLTLYRVSLDSLLSFLLLINDLGVAAPRVAVPRLVIVE